VTYLSDRTVASLANPFPRGNAHPTPTNRPGSRTFTVQPAVVGGRGTRPGTEGGAAPLLCALIADASPAAALCFARAGSALDPVAAGPAGESLRGAARKGWVAGAPELSAAIERVATRLAGALAADLGGSLAGPAAAILVLGACRLVGEPAALAGVAAERAGGIRLARETGAAVVVGETGVAVAPVGRTTRPPAVGPRARRRAVEATLAALRVVRARGRQTRAAFGSPADVGGQAAGRVGAARRSRAAGVGALRERTRAEDQRRQCHRSWEPSRHARTIARKIRLGCHP